MRIAIIYKCVFFIAIDPMQLHDIAFACHDIKCGRGILWAYMTACVDVVTSEAGIVWFIFELVAKKGQDSMKNL